MTRSTTDSYWQATAGSAPRFQPLQGTVSADVAVIGAGITGLTTALHLKQSGYRVVVVEALQVGAGTTGATSAHLDTLPDQGAAEVIKAFGAPAARTLTLARMEAIDQIETWAAESRIDCDFRRIPGYAFSETADGAEKLRGAAASMAELGLEVSCSAEIPLPFAVPGGCKIERQARFHPLRYLYGLAQRIHGGGCQIHEMSRAAPPRCSDSPCVLEMQGGGKVTAQNVVLATQCSYLGISELDTRLAPYISYVIAAKVRQELPDALYWDDYEPYRYIRTASSTEPRLLLIGGADHKTGQTRDEREHLRILETFAREHFAVEEIVYRWSAEYFDSADHVPYIGRVPAYENVFVAAGYLGTGLTFGTMAGRLIAELIAGRKPALADIVSPSRVKPLASAKAFIAENVNAAVQFVGDRVRLEEVDTLDDLAPGEGRVVKYKGERCAAYRDEGGGMHFMSPVCTHAGCYVRWNKAEQCWDCPCHGGRYSPTGERIYGPPPENLQQLTLSGR